MEIKKFKVLNEEHNLIPEDIIDAFYNRIKRIQKTNTKRNNLQSSY